MSDVDLDFLGEFPSADLNDGTDDDIVATVDTETTETTEESEAEWPKHIHLAADADLPEGLLTVPEFTTLVNKYLVAERLKELEEIKPEADKVELIQEALEVQQVSSTFYQLLRGKRYVIPHVIVHTPKLVDGETKDDTQAYFLQDESFKAYLNRPARGTGGNTTPSKMEPEKLLRVSVKTAVRIIELRDRILKLGAELEKRSRLDVRYADARAANGISDEEFNAAVEAELAAKKNKKTDTDNAESESE